MCSQCELRAWAQAHKQILRPATSAAFFTLASLVMGTERKCWNVQRTCVLGFECMPVKQLRPAAYAALFTLASLAGAGGQRIKQGWNARGKCLVAAAEVPVWQRPTAHCHVPVSLRIGASLVLVLRCCCRCKPSPSPCRLMCRSAGQRDEGHAFHVFQRTCAGWRRTAWQ